MGSDKINPTILSLAWDNLFIYSLFQVKQELFDFVTDIIRTDLLLKAAQNNNVQNIHTSFQSKVLLPKTIFPLTVREDEDSDEATEDAVINKDVNQVRYELMQQSRLYAIDIAKLKSAIDDMLQAEVAVYAEARVAMAHYNPTVLDQEGNPIPSGEPMPEVLNNLGLVTDIFWGKLSENTQDMLSERSIEVDKQQVEYAIQLLTKEHEVLSAKMHTGLDLSTTIFVADGIMFEHSSLDDVAVLAAKGSGVVSDIIMPPIDPAILGDIISTGPGSGGSIYTGTVFSGCVVKPLGIGDYRKVEQKLVCNVPGEIAHIDNILKGEVRERSTRRLKRSEETYTTSFESESQEERDTISTERYQLDKATSSVIQRDQAMNVGVNMNASWGAGAYSIAATAGFMSSSSSTTSDEEAVSYAKEVTDKARKLVVERTFDEQVKKLIDEFEEMNKHLIDNKEGTGHVVGIHRWVDKVYEAKVVNYGKRLMFEFMIPDPAAFHRYAMKSGKIADSITIKKPFDPISDIAAIAGLYPGITALKSPADITVDNYKWWAGMYNAEVEAPPQSLKTIGVSKSGMGLSFSGSSNATFVYEDLVVPEGYEAHEH